MSQKHPHFGLNCQMLSFNAGFLGMSLQFHFPSLIGHSHQQIQIKIQGAQRPSYVRKETYKFSLGMPQPSGSDWNKGPAIAHINYMNKD